MFMGENWIFCHVWPLKCGYRQKGAWLARYNHVILEFGGEYARHFVFRNCQLGHEEK